jgi:transglutaminase-like putative cysteine protease/lipoprotein NlpI
MFKPSDGRARCAAVLLLSAAGFAAQGQGQAQAQAAPATGTAAARARAATPASRAATAAAARAAAKPAAAASGAAAGPAAAASAPAAVAARSGPGWRAGPMPAWVVEPPALDTNLPRAPDIGGRRELMFDVQSNYTLAKPQLFVRFATVALDTTALGVVSQPQIMFNPAFQTVVVHAATLLRDGKRLDRLAEARVELMRREQRLEQQMLDGAQTLLLVLNDVRLGEVVEVSYTVEGENPIFEGRIATTMRLAGRTPLERLHWRLTAPATRVLQLRSLGTDIEAQRSVEGPNQVLRIVRQQVPGLAEEERTAPWFTSYPTVQLSEYRDWAELDAWAQRLFALPSPAHPALVARVAAFREQGLSGEALVSDVLRFVQDEVRYLSVSLGESSHRPKPPQQTLADLLGDCKDKTLLLTALLRELGFDARPALVSMHLNRGINSMAAAHDVFDHVITRLELNGRTWWLDGTIQGQGLELATRGQWPYGSALVVGGGASPVALQAVVEPPAALQRLEFEQRWDYSKPGRPVPLQTVLRAYGASAERWRGAAGAGGLEQVGQSLAAGMSRLVPGLKSLGPPELTDDRRANRLEISQRFEAPDTARYERGSVEVDLTALELYDILGSPAETTRRTPYLLDIPKQVDSRIVVVTPLPTNQQGTPPVLEVVDKHFRFSARIELQSTSLTVQRRFERREDAVQPADLVAWRENLTKARSALSGRSRLPLFENASLMPEFERIERRLRSARGWKADALGMMLLRMEAGRHVDTEALKRVEPGSALAGRMLAARAIQNNLLGDFKAGLADADAALAIKATEAKALEARAVALLNQNQLEESLATMARITPEARAADISSMMGALQQHLGRHAEAERLLRHAVDNGSSELREYAVLWLYLAAESQGGRGFAAVQTQLDTADCQKLTGALLQHLAGRLDAEAVLKVARVKPEMERLNMAEASFFIGQRLLVQGKREQALPWFKRTLETGATPYRELVYAQLELARSKP